MEREFRPEFINRIDEFIVFNYLNRDDMDKIIEIEISGLRKRLTEQFIGIDFTPEARACLIEKGYNQDFGARPLRRAISRLIEDPIAEEILAGVVSPGTRVVVRLENGEIRFDSIADESLIRGSGKDDQAGATGEDALARDPAEQEKSQVPDPV